MAVAAGLSLAHSVMPMTELITRSGAWLLQQAAAFPDTVVMKTVAAERGWFGTATDIASGIISIALVALVIVGAPAAWAFWRTFRKTRELLDRVSADIAPITRHASSIADNLNFITTSIREDVQRVNATIAAANRRLQGAVELTESRLNEFNALLRVAQEEAEQAFVSTASAVRGVRTGVATFGAANDELAAETVGGLGDDDDGESDEESRDDGGRPPGAPARPRLRSRGRRR